jgi:thioredoxin reductase (NADPH)
MAKPVIFTIDDDPSVLNSIERDLRAHYGQEYRILPIDSGKAALDYLKKLEQRNEAVALFLVDQRMPEMNGVELLGEAMKAYPQAKRVLLTAYADTQAAIDSINEIGLDYYLMKPWHPPGSGFIPFWTNCSKIGRPMSACHMRAFAWRGLYGRSPAMK